MTTRDDGNTIKPADVPRLRRTINRSETDAGQRPPRPHHVAAQKKRVDSVVRIERGVVTETISDDEPGAVRVTEWDHASGEWQETDLVREQVRPGLPLTDDDDEIDTDRVVWMIAAHGLWWVIAAECPEED